MKRTGQFIKAAMPVISGAVALCFSLNANAALLGVTGDGGNMPETLFSIDQTTGLSTQLITLGNGADGEALAFNPNDGLLYHASGISDGDEFFETINPNTLAIGPNLSSGTYGPDPASELFALAWYAPIGAFLGSDISSTLYSITPSGQFTAIGTNTAGSDYRGLAIVGSRVFGLNPFAAELFEIDPLTGEIINTIATTVDGVSRSGNGLATDPLTGTVYAIFKDPTSTSNRDRVLATLDINTGQATSVGAVANGLAAITFTGAAAVPLPGSLILLAIGVLALRSRRQLAIA